MRFTRSARKHRISRTRAAFVVDNAFAVVEVAGPNPGQVMYMHLGDDERGVALEVGVVIDADEVLVVIHAMPLRNKFRAAYDSGRDQ